MFDDIYNSEILNHAAHITHIGRLQTPDASAYKHSRLCGSTTTVDLNMEDDIITAFAQDVHTCALGQASASIMAQHIIGANVQELKALCQTMQVMLTENGAPPQGKFADFGCLQPVKTYKARHASVMLVFEAIADCIRQIENRR